MAATRFLKTKIEDHVQEWLAKKFGQPFSSKFLPLCGVQGNPKKHEFDAVSEDGAIVCSIKTASWKTSGGKRGSGKIHGVYAELYFLSLIPAKEKYLVLTDPEFSECFTRDCKGRLANSIGLLHCELPEELCKEIDGIRTLSRTELGFWKLDRTMRCVHCLKPLTKNTKDISSGSRFASIPESRSVGTVAACTRITRRSGFRH